MPLSSLCVLADSVVLPDSAGADSGVRTQTSLTDTHAETDSRKGAKQTKYNLRAPTVAMCPTTKMADMLKTAKSRTCCPVRISGSSIPCVARDLLKICSSRG